LKKKRERKFMKKGENGREIGEKTKREVRK